MKPDDSEFSIPPQQVSIDVLLEKYAKGSERTIDDVRRRVARALAAVEADPAHWERIFFEALSGGFLSGGGGNFWGGPHPPGTPLQFFFAPGGGTAGHMGG